MSPLDLEQRAAHLANVRILALSGLADSMRNLGRCLRDAGAMSSAAQRGYSTGFVDGWRARSETP